MTEVDPNLRKAAVLLRSLDADTAAMMLGHLSAEEATAIRVAMRAVGQVETHEQAEVMAEFRSIRPQKNATNAGDVELSLSSSYDGEVYSERVSRASAMPAGAGSINRFEFLESAPIQALVPFLAREHAQTIAVVLSHLAPQRAAEVLAALPQKVQADTIERLSALGDTDPECVVVLQRELEAWVAKRDGSRTAGGRRRDTMAAILAAADAKSRGRILGNSKNRDGIPPEPLAPRRPARPVRRTDISACRPTELARPEKQTGSSALQVEPPLPHFAFDDLIQLDPRALASVMRQVDANVLALALAGSHEELVDRICDQMPKRTARDFRRELRRLGPTRLSDVEGAQQAVAQVAARQICRTSAGTRCIARLNK